MSSTLPPPKTYKNIRVMDPISPIWISPLDSYDTHVNKLKASYLRTTYIILIGPTGSGKSSFIEALASKSTEEPLGIAKDQLESVTKKASVYEIKNLENASYRDEIYIIDTPGFADPKISELEVLEKMTYWRDKCQQSEGLIRLLYFHPITEIRMPASRKRCIDMVQRFWGQKLSHRVLLVTSMWDRVPERSRSATEGRFKKISSSHWGEWMAEKDASGAVKFENTFESAMEILDKICESNSVHDTYPEVSGLGMEGTAGNPVYEALLSRLSSLTLQRATLLEDLAHPTSQGQAELISILNNQLAKTEILLEKFTIEMEDILKRFGLPQTTEAPASVDPGPVDAAPTATDVIDSPPHATQTGSHSMELVDSVPTATGVIVELPQTTQTSQPMESIDTLPTATGVLPAGVEPQTVSLPKRLNQWVHKRVDSIHLGRLGRKGA